jgi:predicted amidohydrolase
MMTPADLFLELWLHLDGFERDVRRITGDGPDAFVARQTAQELVEAEPFDAVNLRSWYGTDLRRQLITAQVIDAFYAPLMEGLSVATLPRVLRSGNRRYLYAGRLDSGDAEHRVILRRPLGGRRFDGGVEVPSGDGIAEYFDTLLVAPPTITGTDPDDAGRHLRIDLNFVMRRAADIRSLPLTSPWRVGFAPLAQDINDITYERITSSDGREWYDSKAIDVPNRVAEVVDVLCRTGCHVIALPEMTITPEMLDVLQQAIRTHGPGSSLVLAGSTRTVSSPGVKPSNRAVILDHRGNEILSQSKLTRWNLTEELCNRYDLLSPAARTLSEYIEVGAEFTVVEVPGVGRVAVLICEDLGRSEPGRWVRRHLLLDLQFTPVMDSDLHLARWAATRGAEAACEGGCRVIVANSLPLTHRQNHVNVRAGATGRVLHDCGIGLLFERDGARGRGAVLRVPLNATGTVAEVIDWDPSSWSTI